MRPARALRMAAGLAVVGAAAMVLARRAGAVEAWRAGGWRITRKDGSVARDRSGAPGGLTPHPRAAKRVGAGVGARARVAPPSWEPATLTALARWEPAAPRTRVGRGIGYAWAAPITVAGLLAGLAGGGRWRLQEGALVCTGVGGLPGALLRRRGFDASALGHVILATGEPGPALLRHEFVHVHQAERLGPLMAPTYLGLLAAYGYARHPMERAARTAQRRERTRPPGSHGRPG